MSADTKPSEACSQLGEGAMGSPSAGLLLDHIEGFLMEPLSWGYPSSCLGWGLEEQELSRVQAWAASVPLDPKAPENQLLSSLLAISAAPTGVHTVMAKTQPLPPQGGGRQLSLP